MLLLTTLLLAIAACSAELDDVKKLALANNEFAFKLHRSLNSEGNFFYSPASIFTALGMLYQGARGKTAEEMYSTLSYDLARLNDDNLNENFKELLSLIAHSSDQYKLDIANAIVSQAQYPFSEEYIEILKNYYSAIVKEVDFEKGEAIKEINNWVSNKTEGKIPRLLESLDPATILVLLNAVYFKGAWESEFSPRRTQNEEFYNEGTDAVSVPMMSAKDRVLYGEESGFKALKLSYKGNAISMLLLLPIERNGLGKLEQELTASKLESIISDMKNVTVKINIPKFKLEDSRELKSTLSSLGMKRVFSNVADFRGISEEERLKVSKIIHKAVVEVNEEGSEAAGATSIQIMPISLPLPPRFSFRAEHPFLFFIIDDRTGMILFFGRVNKL